MEKILVFETQVPASLPCPKYFVRQSTAII